MTTVATHRRMPPLAAGTVVAILLHGLLLLLLLVQFSRPLPPPPLVRKLTIIELQPRKNALALAQLPSPPPSPPKTPPKPKAAPKIHPPPLEHPPEKLLATIPPPAPPKPVPAPPTPAPSTTPTTTSVASASNAAAPSQSSAGVVGRIPQLYLMEVSRIVSVHTITPLKARDAHEKGSPVIRIHLRRDGTVIEASVFQTCGFPDLDESARDEMTRIGKFPELASEYAPGQPDFFIDQPVGFHTQ